MIIGSSALKHHFPDFPREPKDIDIISFDEYDKRDLERIHKGSPKRVEVLINPTLLKYYKEKGGIPSICGKNELYTLKVSHLIGWNINWEKHMWDAQFLLGKGCSLDRELFERLYKMWNIVHSKNRRSDLNMTAEDFFDNALPDGHLHDELHTILNPVPTYSLILKDGAEVEVDENKFNSLSWAQKCNLVYEEVEIMSWERWPEMDYRRAYNKMLKKFIISHAPIWEALFIIENYIHLQKTRHNHFKILNNGITKIKQNIKEFTVA